MATTPLARYELTNTVHDVHEQGILEGVRVGCPRCKGYLLNQTDPDNFLEIVGVTRETLKGALTNLGVSPGLMTCIELIPTLAILVEDGRYSKLIRS